jgi:uncharacterized integral membrane protein
MSIKTIIIVAIAILLTIVLTQNTGSVKFTLLFTDVYVSKLVIMASVAVVAFILGILVGRPKKAKYNIGAYHDSINKKEGDGTLSDDDKDYIS